MANNKIKFSKDPKVQLISIEEFLEEHNYLCEITKKDIWEDNKAPKHEKTYFKFTSEFLICIIYGYSLINFGMDIKEKLEMIEVAYRDGKTEYELLDKKLNEVKKERSKYTENKKLDEQINALEKARKFLPERKETVIPKGQSFESYLSDTGYKTSKEDLKNKYLVFDVETNGIRKSNDDLLSLSIYDPTTGICYNRYFPLELQPLILTGYIHGITDETLSDAVHMTQEEMDWLNEHFHLQDRILLSFSGGQGTFDSSFVQNYCKRQGIIGFENLQFENIKSKIPPAPYGTEGQLTKDNLCRMFGIEGVNETHSSYNDCILEWKLFEILESECVFFINEHLFKYTPEYILPCTCLLKYEELAKYADIKVPCIRGVATEIYKLGFPKNLLKNIKKFPTNITGLTIEHGINRYLHAKKQDNSIFLAENRSHLKYIGSLDNRVQEIPIIEEDDGTVKAIKEEDEEFIRQVNAVTKIIIEHIKPVADYLKTNIFKNRQIMTQELVISDDRKVLALCDLSDSESVVEIKTCDVLDRENNLITKVARQLYFQAKGRNTYVLSIKFDTHQIERTLEKIVDDLQIHLYKVELYEYDPASNIRERELYYYLDYQEIDVLKMIEANPRISKSEAANRIGCSSKSVGRIFRNLEFLNYIKKDDPNSRKPIWILLRSSKDLVTKIRTSNDLVTTYTVADNKVTIVK